MPLTEEEKKLYAAKFHDEVVRAAQEEERIRQLTAESFQAILKGIVDKIAPGLWDRVKDSWQAIYDIFMQTKD